MFPRLARGGIERLPRSVQLLTQSGRLRIAMLYSVVRADFENARKTLWIEYELRSAELTTKGTLYQV